MLNGLQWIDLAMLVILGLSGFVGVLRGLVSEVMSLAGWLVAWLLAQAWGPDVAVALHIGVPGGPVARLGGVAITFVVTLLAWRVLAWLLKQVIQATPLAPLDRLAGALFGLLRGALILSVLVMVLGFTPLTRQTAWQDSTGVRWLSQVQDLLPADWRLTPAESAPAPADAPAAEPAPASAARM